MIEPYKASIMHMKSLIVILEACSTNSDQSVSIGVLKDCNKNLEILIGKLEPLLKNKDVN